jgi:hypothetical protein
MPKKVKKEYKPYYYVAIAYVVISFIIILLSMHVNIKSFEPIWYGTVFAWMVVNGLSIIYIIWKREDPKHAIIPSLFLIDFLISSNIAYFISQFDQILINSPAYMTGLLIIPIIILVLAMRKVI